MNAPGGNKVQNSHFTLKVFIKVARSLILVLFGRVSLFEYAAKCEVCISNSSKVRTKVKGFDAMDRFTESRIE